MEDTLKIATTELEKAQNRYKHYYDRSAKDRRFKIGDTVLILLPTEINKLLMQQKGPYEVFCTIGENDYRVKIGEKIKTYHAYLLNYIIKGAKKLRMIYISRA